MDTFVEQIVTIKRTVKTYLAYICISIAAILLMVVSYFLFSSLFIAVDALIVFGAYKLYSMLNIEYEYIITNSTMDIDKIIAKSSRKRIVSFDLTAVLRIEKFTGILPSDIAKNCFFACNEKDENAYLLVYKSEGKPQQAFVFAPDDRMISGMKNFLPRHICENLE